MEEAGEFDGVYLLIMQVVAFAAVFFVIIRVVLPRRIAELVALITDEFSGVDMVPPDAQQIFAGKGKGGAEGEVWIGKGSSDAYVSAALLGNSAGMLVTRYATPFLRIALNRAERADHVVGRVRIYTYIKGRLILTEIPLANDADAQRVHDAIAPHVGARRAA